MSIQYAVEKILERVAKQPPVSKAAISGIGTVLTAVVIASLHERGPFQMTFLFKVSSESCYKFRSCVDAFACDFVLQPSAKFDSFGQINR